MRTAGIALAVAAIIAAAAARAAEVPAPAGPDLSAPVTMPLGDLQALVMGAQKVGELQGAADSIKQVTAPIWARAMAQATKPPAPASPPAAAKPAAPPPGDPAP